MRKNVSKLIVLIYVCSVFVFSFNMMKTPPNEAEDVASSSGFDMTATELGMMCISTAYPSIGIQLADSRDNEMESGSGELNKIETLESEAVDKEETGSSGGDLTPKVLIVHTHATESYLPTSQGNFHTREEANTVRDVGNILEKTLEAKGIGVIHDKTLHDYPSYNDSYYRSRETVAAILQKNPTIECVIDLHRDAVASTAPAATISVGGKTCAKYSYVIGTTAQTYSSNKAFINRLNKIATQKYYGFTGAIIERGYAYNQDLSSKYLLVEIGFNRNQIEDSRNTAAYVGGILAEGLKDENNR